LEFKIDDKHFGCRLLHAYGDALGAPSEFTKVDKICMQNYTRNSWGRKIVGIAGQITDDTEMAMIAYRNRGLPKEEQVMNYIDWASGFSTGMPCKTIGRLTKSLFNHTGNSLEAMYQKYLAVYSETYSSDYEMTQTNGSLMRAAGLYGCSEKEFMRDCKISNRHINNIHASRIYYRMLHFKQDMKTLFREATDEEATDDLKEAYNMGRKRILRDITKNKGWICHAIYCAALTYSWLDEEINPRKLIKFIIKLGGDTDTNAAICGGILGAYLGFDKIYSYIREEVQIMLEADTHSGSYPRPKRYTFKRGMKDIGLLEFLQ
jgi:ADP-ribosyl-[dinitrogen reductase] hydrolase